MNPARKTSIVVGALTGLLLSLATHLGGNTALASVQFFVSPDGGLNNADPSRDLPFQQALSRSMTEFDLHEFAHGYIFEPSPLFAASVRVRPALLKTDGSPAADLTINGNRLLETYPVVPDIPGIIEGDPAGGAALLNRTFNGAGDVVGAAIEFTFSEPAEGFGTWIMDDFVEPSRYVLRITEYGGAVSNSAPIDSGNGANLAIEGFIGAVSDLGIIRAVIEQQRLDGTPSIADFFYLDHFQVGARIPPEVCDNGVDDNADGQIDCADPECNEHESCRENCTDQVDNDGNGLVDCDDPDCQNNPAHPECGETFCDDGQDNDGDGQSDCADADCFGQEGCTRETLCGDGQDNDADGHPDCADSDCTEDPVCPENCTDGIDNDADGRVDCQDLECMVRQVCPTICEDISPPSTPSECVDPTCLCLPGCHEAPAFFVQPDGRLHDADPDGDLAFQAALTRGFTEFDFEQFQPGYLLDPTPLLSGNVRIRPVLLTVDGQMAVDPQTNGGRLLEMSGSVPDIPGIIEGDPAGGTALLNRTVTSGGAEVAGAGVRFSFSHPVEAFGVWILEDHQESDRFVLKVTETDGRVFVSAPLESGNGASLAVEGFIGVVSQIGITEAVVEQQMLTMGGVGIPSGADFFYLDHLQTGHRLCEDPFADLDGDGDVDQDDFGLWQRCLSGPHVVAESPCDCADRDGDGDVDTIDFGPFGSCVSGPNQPADVNCDD